MLSSPSSMSPGNTKGTYKWFVLLLATLSQTSIAYVGQGVAAIAPVLQASFHLSAAQVGMAVSANNVGIGLTALTFGAIVDRFGDKRVMVIGGLMTGVTILVATRASDFAVLLILLAVTGMWTGGATPAGSKAIFKHFDPLTRGTAMGIRQMGVTAGGFIAALTLPLIAAGRHWQHSLEFASAMVVTVSLATLVFYRDRSRLIPSPGRKSPTAATSASTAPSAQTASPMHRRMRRVLTNRSVWFASIGGTTLLGAQFAVLGYAQLFLHTVAGISLHYTFYFLAAAQLSGMVGRTVFGGVSDKLFASKRKPMVLLIAAAIILLTLLMLLVSRATPWWLLLILFALMGLMSMGWNGLWVTWVSELVDPADSSSALGAAMTLLQAGVLVYPIPFGLIVDHFHSYTGSWLFTATTVLGGLLLLSRVPEK